MRAFRNKYSQSDAAASMTCSQLSRMIKLRLSARNAQMPATEIRSLDKAAKRRRNRVGQVVRVADRCSVHEANVIVAEFRSQRVRDSQRNRGLPIPPGPTTLTKRCESSRSERILDRVAAPDQLLDRRQLTRSWRAADSGRTDSGRVDGARAALALSLPDRDRRHERIAAAGHVDDISRTVLDVSQHLAQRGDRHAQIGLLDDNVGPTRAMAPAR